MIELANVTERSFQSLKDLKRFLAKQDTRDHKVPICQISLNKAGRLRAGEVEGPLAETGLQGLFNILDVDWHFGMEVCPPDFLKNVIHRLVRDRKDFAHILIQEGIVTSIMPADRMPIRIDVLVDWLGINEPIEEAILGSNYLRITSLTKGYKELLPGDVFGFGWELQNNEGGWLPTQACRYVMVRKCKNGMVGFDKTAVFVRGSTSHKPILESLEGLTRVLQTGMDPPELESTIKWAHDTPLRHRHELVLNYLARRLEGDATKLALNDISPDTSWYQLLNKLTSLARVHQLSTRRSYEVAGGILLRWFLSQGRTRPPWEKMSCEECPAWSNGPLEALAAPADGHEVN